MEMQVDWHEFVVVEKIDLYDDEEMKMIQEEEEAEEARLRQEEQQRVIKMRIQENEQLINMPMAEVPHESQRQAPHEVFISTALDPEMKVKRNYQRGEEQQAPTTPAVPSQKCPKCQQEIPVSEWKEHMRLELMNPKWREEKIKREERGKLQSLASGNEIAANLKKFAQERREIFPGA